MSFLCSIIPIFYIISFNQVKKYPAVCFCLLYQAKSRLSVFFHLVPFDNRTGSIQLIEKRIWQAIFFWKEQTELPAPLRMNY